MWSDRNNTPNSNLWRSVQVNARYKNDRIVIIPGPNVCRVIIHDGKRAADSSVGVICSVDITNFSPAQYQYDSEEIAAVIAPLIFNMTVGDLN